MKNAKCKVEADSFSTLHFSFCTFNFAVYFSDWASITSTESFAPGDTLP